MHTQNDIHKISTASPLVYGVTRGQLPQRAGSLGLTAVGLPPRNPTYRQDKTSCDTRLVVRALQSITR